MVICRVGKETLKDDYFEFLPLRSLESEELEREIREFVESISSDYIKIFVHCDSHTSIVKV